MDKEEENKNTDYVVEALEKARIDLLKKQGKFREEQTPEERAQEFAKAQEPEEKRARIEDDISYLTQRARERAGARRAREKGKSHIEQTDGDTERTR